MALVCKYSCDLCGLTDVEVNVPFRYENQDVVDWMKKVAIPRFQMDHQKRSPNCHPKELKAVKIPISKGDDCFIGGPVND